MSKIYKQEHKRKIDEIATNIYLEIKPGKLIEAKIQDKNGNILPFPCLLLAGETYWFVAVK